MVSNKHVLVGAKSISLAFTHSANGTPEHGNNIKFSLAGIDSAAVGHPSPNVDVAVIDCTGIFVTMQDNIFCKTVPLDLLSDFSEPELGVAENVYFIGYEYLVNLRKAVKANASGYGTPSGNFINVGCMMPYMDYTPRTLEEIIEGDRKLYGW